MSIRIDFIAGHQLQARAGESVFEALSERADCRWRIGRDATWDGADAAVLMDHTQHHPAFQPSLKLRPAGAKTSWKKTFYLMHDLGDVLAYKQERKALRRFSMIIVPDALHARLARRHLWWWTKVKIGGWPKYDVPATPPLFTSLKQPTILYAPTWAGKDEWRRLLPALSQLPVNVIVKNHTYATTPGEPVSEFYKISRVSVAAMEEAARNFEVPMLVAPPELNICALFPHVDAVFTDQSSVAAEFLPWGLAIETGAQEEGEAGPGISRWYPAVRFQPLPVLLSSLENGGQQFLREVKEASGKPGPQTGAGQAIANMIWEEICR